MPVAPRPAHNSQLDELFRKYDEKLPEPDTISEQNGASLECPRHGWVTYTLLYGAAHRLPIESDDDLVRLVRWARHDDVCIRQMAMDAIVERIKLDPNNLSVPGMHEPEDYQHHEIFVALRKYFDAKSISFDPQIFAGMMLDVTAKDFAMMNGRWEEEATASKNFVQFVEFDGELLRVTLHRVEPSPKWPDRTTTTKVGPVTVNDRHQFVIPHDAESTYLFWPVRADIVWFHEGVGYWTKLRKKGG